MTASPSHRLLLLAVSVMLSWGAFSIRVRAAPGDVDLSFDAGSGISSMVQRMAVQPDGKILITGDFTRVRGLQRAGIARILPDGAGDATFDAGSSGFGISSLALQPDGKIVCATEAGLIRFDADGGGKTLINIETFAKTCRPWGCSYGINTLAVQPDGKILIGGYFMTRNGDATNYGIARIFPDGVIDPGFSATVAPPVEGRPTSDGVSMIDVLPDGKLVIAGYFSRVNGVPRPGIARLHSDGRLDEIFDTAGAIVGGAGLAATQSDGKVLVANSSFTTAGANPVMARFNTDGSFDTGFHFDSSLLDSLWLLVEQPDGKIIIAGFVNTFGWEGPTLLRLMPDGSLDRTFDAPAMAGELATVNAISVQGDGTILVGGEINGAREQRVNGLARFHPDGSLDAGFRSDTGLTGIVSPNVRSVAVQADGKVLIGGPWTRYAGPVFGITRLQSDGIPDPAFSPPGGISGKVLALQPDGKILAAGGAAVNRLLPDGGLDITFRAAVHDLPLANDCPPDWLMWGGQCSEGFGVTAMAAQPDGRILIGGFRSTVLCSADERCHKVDRLFVARLHADGRYDDIFNLGNFDGDFYTPIQSLLVQPDGRVLVAGSFTVVDGQPRPGLARLNPDGDLDVGFVPGLQGGGETLSLALQLDGRILVGRVFYDSALILRHEIARLHPDGSPDASFNAGEGVNGPVYSMLLQPDGRVILAGSFTRAGGAGRYNIARLHPDGSMDGSFIAGTTGGVFAMAATADGGIFIGGQFTAVNGFVRPGVAKLHAEPGGVVSFATWAARFALSEPNATADGDPDRDGLPNAAEYILGGNPATPDRWNRPAATVNGGSILFTFSRADESETSDLTLTVESGTDLVSWPDVFTVGPNTAASSPGVSIVENGTAPDTITVPIPAGSGNARFARLKATVAP